MASDTDYDVIVVGCGIAGLSAAVSAHQSSARVLVLERAPIEERGGNTRWTESLLRMKSEAEVSDDFEQRLLENSGYYLDPALVDETSRDFSSWPSIVKTLNFTDPEFIASFSSGVAPTIAWLKNFGIKFDLLPTYFITASSPRMAPVGGGLALVEALAGYLEREGVSILYETTARAIDQQDGKIVGIRTVDRVGAQGVFKANNVVLASGGFEGNPEMLARYIGPQARYIRPVARGGYYNKGEGIQMALALGAAPAGDFSAFHAEPIDPRSGMTEPVILALNYGVLVNKSGNRFVDEATNTIDMIYEAVSRKIWQQQDGIAYLILDRKIDDVPNWKKSIRTDQAPIVAETIDALAEKLKLPASALRRTIGEFNQSCLPAGVFLPLARDGLSTHSISPSKSNWARPIDSPPFLAYPITCANCFTFGGLKIDTDARVLDLDGVPIEGLYAAGETMGIYYGTYTGATSVLRGAVFGRKAGLHSARRRTQ